MADEVKETQETGKKKKSRSSVKKVLIIWLPLFILQLIITYMIVSKVVRPKLSPVTQELQAKTKKKKAKKKGDTGPIYMVEDVIVNPKNTFGKRFLNVSVGFECKSGRIVKELEKRDVHIRDYLISLFTDRTIEQLDDVADKDSLRAEIRRHVNEMLPKEGIIAVYFSNFIIQ